MARLISAELLRVIRDQYQLDPRGIHGFAHWARVRENGLSIAAAVGANDKVVELFALFHDCRRLSDGFDLEHGRRGAEFALGLRGRLFSLPEQDLELLLTACRGHSTELTHPQPTVQACWDADRLDLARIGVDIDTRFLSTEAAREPEFLRWANDRGRTNFVPDILRREWRSLMDNK